MFTCWALGGVVHAGVEWRAQRLHLRLVLHLAGAAGLWVRANACPGS